jgi:uncharacterized membrane protein YphA (DoxX/SURF4 family)
MTRLYLAWDRIDIRLHRWLVRHSIAIVRISLGAIFLFFGAMKFFPGISPIEDLVIRTVDALSFGLVSGAVGMKIVATVECAIGLCFLTNKLMRIAVWLLMAQMIGAMSPLLLFPGELFSGRFNAPTLAAQYIVKDVVLVGAGLVIAATWKGGHLVSGPRTSRMVPLRAQFRAGDMSNRVDERRTG